ncbi:histidine kinase [Tolypothrix sp. VBCCA 56010]
MGNGQWAMGIRERGKGKGEIIITNAPCPMPHAPFPMPDSQCPMPDSQCP